MISSSLWSESSEFSPSMLYIPSRLREFAQVNASTMMTVLIVVKTAIHEGRIVFFMARFIPNYCNSPCGRYQLLYESFCMPFPSLAMPILCRWIRLLQFWLLANAHKRLWGSRKRLLALTVRRVPSIPANQRSRGNGIGEYGLLRQTLIQSNLIRFSSGGTESFWKAQ